MKFVLAIVAMLVSSTAYGQCPGGCSVGAYPTFNGRLFTPHNSMVRAGDSFPVRHARQAERQARRVQYAPHVTYEPHYRAGDILYVPRVTRLPRFNPPLRPQAYYYSDLLNYQGNFSYGN